MKHHKYYNTIWTERDQEFWWDGIKSGTIAGSIIAVVLGVWGVMIYHKIKK